MFALRARMYAADRSFILDGIGRYKNSKAIASALVLAESILNYRATYGWRWQLELERRMAVLRDAGKSPMDVLIRVVESYSLIEKNPRLFKTPRAEHVAHARWVLHLTTWGKWRPNTRLLTSLGSMLADDLGAFAIQLLRRLQNDLAERQALRRSAADFDTVQGISK
jgi:hypothetical protein